MSLNGYQVFSFNGEDWFDDIDDAWEDSSFCLKGRSGEFVLVIGNQFFLNREEYIVDNKKSYNVRIYVNKYGWFDRLVFVDNNKPDDFLY